MNRTLALTFAAALVSFGCAPDTAPPDDTTLRMRVDRDVGEGQNIFGNDNLETEPVKLGDFVAYAGWVGTDDVAVIIGGPFVAEEMVIDGQACTGLDATLGVPPDDVVVDGAAPGIVFVLPAEVALPESGSVTDLGDIEFDIRRPEYVVSLSNADREAGGVEGLSTIGNDWAIVGKRTDGTPDQRFAQR